MGICKVLFLLFRGLFVSRSNLILENLALRRQRTIKQPKTPKFELYNSILCLCSWTGVL